ncbi:Dymeclin [Radiomyces spectabilis]|uniref:Dymeclin n=1 Tax=Radiomyces spectabilis TaxID=64574 RepID=UPI00221EC23F|nr:Dymeclin [Radiomyces spectabilis]KAI8371481.1 Dymeclin [Radiomyces spectabilis]
MDVLMERFSNRTDAIVAKLLENATEQKSPPAQSSSMVYSAYNYLFASRTGSAGDADSLPVADRSLLLLLLLATQRSSNGEWAGYRHALKGLRDHHVLSSDLENMDQKIHLISYKEMFELFCRSLANEERMLLFYLMLIENESFRVYVLSRTDPEIIYIPMLKLIYESIEGKTNYSQLYVLLTCLLIFSQDDVNNETIQKIMSNNLAWFTERPLLKSISLGGLVTLVLIRTLQLNLSHQKDIYFHTNCLAILANMSSAMLDMHAYVAQRIISLFELIARRYQKFTAKMQETGEEDVSVFEDLLALMLEIINCVLSHRLKNNIQLVYVLLLKRDIFAPFRLHTRFSDLIYNIEQVINYFNGRVSDANLKAPSTSEVLRVIEQAARTWSPNQLKSLPDLKFQYEEEMDAREFFLPYIWALIHRRTFIYWSEEKAHILQEYRLLNMDTADDGDPHHEK